VDLQEDIRYELLSTFSSDAFTMIGGQAVSSWRAALGLQDATGTVSTSDLDFLFEMGAGGSELLKAIAEKLGGHLHTATMDQATTQIAKLVVPHVGRRGEPLVVDLLSVPHGMDAKRVRRNARRLRVNQGPVLRVMHPMHCLESAVANRLTLPSPKYRSREYLTRIRAICEIVKAWTNECAKSEATVREAYRTVEALGRYAETRLPIQLHREEGIDVLSSLPDDCEQSPLLGDAFWRRRLPQIHSRVEAKRERDRNRIEATSGHHRP